MLELSITETQLCVSVEANTVRLPPAVVRIQTPPACFHNLQSSLVWPMNQFTAVVMHYAFALVHVLCLSQLSTLRQHDCAEWTGEGKAFDSDD